MDLTIALLFFIAAMVLTIRNGISMVIALLAGLGAFLAAALHRGFHLRDLLHASFSATKEAFIVSEIMAVIGVLTGIWRLSGTISVFVYYGMGIIRPHLFLLVAFFLSCLLSYALGTSFGVAATVGIIFMALARSGGVDPVITAGALMSGVFFGDRCSPVSSSAQLVAGVTGTNIYDNLRRMLLTGIPSFLLCLGIYAVFSFFNPLSHIDPSLVKLITDNYSVSLWTMLPAFLMVLLPLFRVDVLLSMAVSILCATIVGITLQGAGMGEILHTYIFGYETKVQALASIVNGGGLLSMMEVVLITFISAIYSGIFRHTGMLDALQNRLAVIVKKIGRFGTTTATSLVIAAIFCNQTVAVLMERDILGGTYEKTGGTKEELAIDMENSVILLACLLPWTIGSMVPLAFFGVGPVAMLFSFYMYLTPLTYLFFKAHMPLSWTGATNRDVHASCGKKKAHTGAGTEIASSRAVRSDEVVRDVALSCTDHTPDTAMKNTQTHADTEGDA